MIGQQKERRVIKHLKTMSTPAAGAGFLSEWKARSIYRTTHEAACFACGTRIMHVVQLVNEASGMLCNLGTDCYDEVRRRVHGFPTIVRDRAAESDSAVKVVNAHYARFSEAGGQRFQTWRGWLLAALRERRVPDALVKGVQELKAAGTIADLELLWGCINFHDKTRTESALFLLGRVMACRIYPNDPNRIITIRKAQDLLGLKPLSVEKLRGHGPNGRSDFGATPPRLGQVLLRLRYLAGVGRLWRTGQRGQSLERLTANRPTPGVPQGECGWCGGFIKFTDEHFCQPMRDDLRHALALAVGAERVALLSDPACRAFAETMLDSAVSDANALAIKSADMKRIAASITKARALHFLPTEEE